MNIQVSIDSHSAADSRASDRPANILIVANFSGCNAPSGPESDQEFIGNIAKLDPYDIDSAISHISPRVTFDGEGRSITIAIQEIDDFHPDALYRNLDIFSLTGDLKMALSDPAKAPQALVIASELTGVALPEAADILQPVKPEDEEEDMFSRLLGRSRDNSPATSDKVKKLLHEALGSDAIAPVPANTRLMQEAINQLEQSAMRDLLGNRALRVVEAAWRSTEWFGQHIESDDGINIWLFDVGDAAPDSWIPQAQSRIRQSLAGEAISMIAVLDDFSDSDESAMQLRALDEFASAAACTVLTGADARLAGLRGSLDTHFAVDASDIECDQSEFVRQMRSGMSAAVGLGFPRMILRQPYGKRSDPVDAFEFEELDSNPDHEAFFWVSAAIGLAAVWLAQYQAQSSDLHICDLPLVTYDDGSGQSIKPPSEIYLSDSAAEAILTNGVIPLIGRRGDTSVRIPRLQSMANPPTGL